MVKPGSQNYPHSGSISPVSTNLHSLRPWITFLILSYTYTTDILQLVKQLLIHIKLYSNAMMDKMTLIGSSYGNRFILTYHTTGKRIAPQQSRSTKIKSSL